MKSGFEVIYSVFALLMFASAMLVIGGLVLEDAMAALIGIFSLACFSAAYYSVYIIENRKEASNDF